MKLIRLKEVMEITGLGRSSIYKFMIEKTFPQSISLGDRAVAWEVNEIDEWIMSKIENRNENEDKQTKSEKVNKVSEKEVVQFINDKFSGLAVNDAIVWLMTIYK